MIVYLKILISLFQNNQYIISIAPLNFTLKFKFKYSEFKLWKNMEEKYWKICTHTLIYKLNITQYLKVSQIEIIFVKNYFLEIEM